ncbi:hypothetical protein GTU79_11500 [Sodalis ligni]|uniref:hypothetical protein n=1 Tax=Sodalis ligni TaxID=2697027 RepID=UPI00193FE31E|nr:hypothetical protein [Sodalis ligni]QWA13211.1 hypothetical protein GTU79_11500 [Sodalis ligni]
MSENEFNRIHCLFMNHEPAEAVRQLRDEFADRLSGLFSGGHQLQPGNGAVDIRGVSEWDRVLAYLGLSLQYNEEESSKADNATQLIASVAARIGLLMRVLEMSWRHLSTRKSFGIKTTRHQLVKAEFADISSQAGLLLLQWRMRLAIGDFEGVEADHWHITVLTNRAEKLMGGHGYLLGATHTLSYLSMMIYSLYGKTAGHYAMP